MSKTIAIAYAVCASETIRPDGVTYSARNAARTSSAMRAVALGVVAPARAARAARATLRGGEEEVRARDDVAVGLRLRRAGPAERPGRASRRTGTCPSHRRRSPAISSSVSTHDVMLGYCRSSIATSAKRSCSTHGTTVAASPHAAAGLACAEHVRHDERHDAAARLLLEREVAQPRVEEAAHVVEEARGRREHLDVAGPAQPLVALRAVGREVEEVAAHAPHDVLVQLVDERVRGVEPAGALHVAVQHDGGHRRPGRTPPASPPPRRSGSRGR